MARPDSLNAVDSATRNELEAIWSQLETSADVRVIVLTGAGDRAFCVGADLKEAGRHGLDYWAHPTPGGFGGIALRETLNILLEGMPRGVDLTEVSKAVCAVEGVLDVHDLHIWCIGSNSSALSCHVLIEDMPPSRSDRILHAGMG